MKKIIIAIFFCSLSLNGCSSGEITFMHFIKKEIDFKNSNKSDDNVTGMYIGKIKGGCSLKGKISNVKKLTIRNATIQLERIGDNSTDNFINLKASSDGSFQISNIEEGLYNIIVISTDYEPEILENYKLEKNNSPIEINFTLIEE